MQLEKLKISKAGQLIREIEFKSGLNLILDKTTGSATESGNNVGKTTVLRMIDYCLGSDGLDIWTDPEFKKVNQEVFDFLHGSMPVRVTLTFSGYIGELHELERCFVAPRIKVSSAFVVDGEIFKNLRDYQTAVKKILFGSDGLKPSLRQLMPKFVRSNSAKMGRTLKFLGEYGSNAVYEAVHLFLFGFSNIEVLEERPRLDLLQKKQTRDLQALTRDRGEGEIEQLLFHLRREIEQIELMSILRGEVPEIAAQASSISKIRSDAAFVSGELSSFQAEITSIEMALEDFKRDYVGVDAKVIESIYAEAEAFIPEIHDKWEELTEFVNSLRQRKERFLISQLTYLNDQKQKQLKILGELEFKEAASIQNWSNSAEFQMAIAVRTDLLEKTKRLGSLEQDLKDIQSLKARIDDTEAALAKTQKAIDEGNHLLQERLKVFNVHFSNYSKRLYGEQYLLHTEEVSGGTLSFKLSAVGANVGTGKKASQTSAFDLAYCEFLKEVGLSFPQFICHDGQEAIHDNQWRELLIAANEFGGQLLVSTLRDKLPPMPANFLKANTVVELSQEDMLFCFKA